MVSRSAVRVALICCLLGGIAAVCAGQTYTPPPPPLTTLPPCPADKNGKPIKKKQKNCDPTVYPSETVATKDKKFVESAAPSAPVAPAPGAVEQKFPYPGEQPAKPADTPAAKAFPYPGEAAPAAPSTPVPSAPAPNAPDPDSPAARSYPYPGEKVPDVPHDPAAAAKAADTPAGKAYPFPGGATPDMPSDPDEPSSSSSSSSDTYGSSSSSSSGDAADAGSGSSAAKNTAKNDDDDDESDTPKLKDKGSSGRRTLKVVKAQSDTERVDEDLSVARFYGQSGNKMGAYLRAKDAVKLQPDYAEAHYVLAEAAKSLEKRDEAAAEFRAYLKLAPDGDKAKAAEKALEKLP